jgi:hypothetical protein
VRRETALERAWQQWFIPVTVDPLAELGEDVSRSFPTPPSPSRSTTTRTRGCLGATFESTCEIITRVRTSWGCTMTTALRSTRMRNTPARAREPRGRRAAPQRARPAGRTPRERTTTLATSSRRPRSRTSTTSTCIPDRSARRRSIVAGLRGSRCTASIVPRAVRTSSTRFGMYREATNLQVHPVSTARRSRSPRSRPGP